MVQEKDNFFCAENYEKKIVHPVNLFVFLVICLNRYIISQIQFWTLLMKNIRWNSLPVKEKKQVLSLTGSSQKGHGIPSNPV